MIRILVSTLLSFSILTASNITAGNAGEILKGSQTSTLSVDKFDSRQMLNCQNLKAKKNL